VVDIPNIKKWSDIGKWFIKWGTLHYVIKGEKTWHELMLDLENENSVDWKRPISVTIYDPKTHDVIEEQEE
jgi:hypothetical protein